MFPPILNLKMLPTAISVPSMSLFPNSDVSNLVKIGANSSPTPTTADSFKNSTLNSTFHPSFYFLWETRKPILNTLSKKLISTPSVWFFWAPPLWKMSLNPSLTEINTLSMENKLTFTSIKLDRDMESNSLKPLRSCYMLKLTKDLMLKATLNT